jgi:hypothetical protein
VNPPLDAVTKGSRCVFDVRFMYGDPFDAEACDIGRQASATNGSPDMKTHIENAACNRPLRGFVYDSDYDLLTMVTYMGNYNLFQLKCVDRLL